MYHILQKPKPAELSNSLELEENVGFKELRWSVRGGGVVGGFMMKKLKIGSTNFLFLKIFLIY